MSNKRFFYFHDCETTGTDPDVHQMLTYSALVASFEHKRFHVEEAISLHITHPNYVVDPLALEVNGIDLVKHHNKSHAVNLDEAAKQIRDFRVRFQYKIGLNESITLAGHRIEFDNAFVSKIVPEFDAWFDMIPLDTKRIAEFFKLAGKYSLEEKTSLINLAEHFGISVEYDKLHVSDYDSLLTMKVLEKMVNS